MKCLSSLAAALSGLTLMVSTLAPSAAQSISADEAHAIATEAYVYFYPLVTMDVTRKQLTNSERRGPGIGGPMNTFVNIPAFPTADMRAVVRPNFDTLYSCAWLDLTKEPMVVLGAGHRRALLPAADARHVDRRVRLAGLAHDRHAGRQLPGRAARLERNAFLPA